MNRSGMLWMTQTEIQEAAIRNFNQKRLYRGCKALNLKGCHRSNEYRSHNSTAKNLQLSSTIQ